MHVSPLLSRGRSQATGPLEDAIASYEAALAREAAFPKLQTQAYHDLPYRIAAYGIRAHYGKALELLQNHEARLMFPVDRFRWHAARALIAADLKKAETARRQAEQAIEAAGHEHSGFRYHPSVGLVTADYNYRSQKA